MSMCSARVNERTQYHQLIIWCGQCNSITSASVDLLIHMATMSATHQWLRHTDICDIQGLKRSISPHFINATSMFLPPYEPQEASSDAGKQDPTPTYALQVFLVKTLQHQCIIQTSWEIQGATAHITLVPSNVQCVLTLSSRCQSNNPQLWSPIT